VKLVANEFLGEVARLDHGFFHEASALCLEWITSRKARCGERSDHADRPVGTP
jgi:hypothetical protein